jgi:hypothetical protein
VVRRAALGVHHVSGGVRLEGDQRGQHEIGALVHVAVRRRRNEQ